jgi:hypothetical protein
VTASEVRISQQKKRDGQRHHDVLRLADKPKQVWRCADGVARKRVDHEHDSDREQERDKPRRRPARTQRHGRVSGYEERPDETGARAGDPAPDKGRKRDEHGPGADQREDVSIEGVAASQHGEVADTEHRESDGQQPAQRVPLRLDRQRERGDDRQVPRHDPDALAQSPVIVVRRVVGDSDEPDEIHGRSLGQR